MSTDNLAVWLFPSADDDDDNDDDDDDNDDGGERVRE
jgi:hypothetical protein